VIGLDHEKQRVSLSIKSQFTDPWNEVANHFKVMDKVEGTITRVKHFGAFVEVYPGVEALLPSKDIMDYETAQGAKLEVGQKINTFIVKFNPEERRISLSFSPNPESSHEEMGEPVTPRGKRAD
jgi:ribosomal protein S1